MNFKKEKKNKVNRYIGLLVIMVIIFGILINQMVSLQVINGAEYYNRANVEFIKNIDNQSPRGEILDREGRVLASSTQSYNLIYVDTIEVRKVLFKTMDKVRELLTQSNQEINDTLALKSEPFRFEFGSNDADYIKRSELRWKKDRGINDYLFLDVVSKETGKSKISDLNEKETDYLDELILAFTPTQTYHYLMKFYNLYEALDPTKEEKELFKKMDGEQIHEALLKEFDEETIRSYLLIKDNIKMESYSGSKAVTLVQNMTENSAFTFLHQLSGLPGIDVETNPIRIYPYETLGSHVIGYLNPIPEESKDHYEERGYDISKDYIGRSGIESMFEERLKGNKGVRTVEVDKNGRPTRELFELEPYPGNNIQLTLDANLQNTAERALEDMIINLSEENTKHSIAGYYQDSSNANRGAVVAIEVATGNVLALASYPKYDPNVFAVPGRLTDELYEEFFNPDYRGFAEELIQEKNVVTIDSITNTSRKATFDDLFRTQDDGRVIDPYDLYPKPLFNYATLGLAPPGSTFKLVTGLAALEEGVIGANTIINDRGAFVNDQIGT
ncbi:MAG: penicillin-binding protein, partial [Clostridium sp.]|nr:penicillin-binding protein [Clostridium sp.]